MTKKGWEKLEWRKTQKFREIHFKNTEEFFQRERDTERKKLIKHVFVRKNAFLQWKRIEKRKGRSFRKEETFFFFEKCAKENSKTIFFLTIFLSIRRATTRRVNIKIRHERDSKLSRNSKVKNQESHFFVCKNALLERKRIEK